MGDSFEYRYPAAHVPVNSKSYEPPRGTYVPYAYVKVSIVVIDVGDEDDDLTLH